MLRDNKVQMCIRKYISILQGYIYGVHIYTPFYICVYGAHVFNVLLILWFTCTYSHNATIIICLFKIIFYFHLYYIFLYIIMYAHHTYFVFKIQYSLCINIFS